MRYYTIGGIEDIFKIAKHFSEYYYTYTCLPLLYSLYNTSY